MSNADEILEPFIHRNLILEVLFPVKSGKEATVYCCRAHPSTGAEHLAAKVHRPRERRNFKNDSVYQEGRWYWRLGGRSTRAFNTKTRFGREVQAATWLAFEYEMLETLFAAGVSVPEPLECGEGAILMEYVGSGTDSAPHLESVTLSREEAHAASKAVVADVERMLRQNVVHADLSGYNVLYASGRPRVIDLPQCVDARFNASAFELLRRDLANVHRPLARAGARVDTDALALEMWTRYVRGEL